MSTPPDIVRLFHITHVRNLEGIVQAGGLLSYNQIRSHDLDYLNLAHGNIQGKRARQHVPCGPGGTLHDYVPFYFGPRSPMLFAINKGNVEGYDGGQEPVIHLVSTLDRVKRLGSQYVFTDGHGVMAYVGFFDNDAELEKIDWPLMTAQYWLDNDKHPNRAFRRQAEFLILDRFPWDGICEIRVLNDAVKSAVETALGDAGHRPPVHVDRQSYY